MARPKSKNSKAVNINMEISVAQKLEEYCNETGLSKTVAIERILEKFFEENNKELLDAMPPCGLKQIKKPLNQTWNYE